MMMRWRFWVSGTALRAYPGKVRWKQHGWVNSTLPRPHHRRIRSQARQQGLRSGQCGGGNEVDLVQK